MSRIIEFAARKLAGLATPVSPVAPVTKTYMMTALTDPDGRLCQLAITFRPPLPRETAADTLAPLLQCMVSLHEAFAALGYVKAKPYDNRPAV